MGARPRRPCARRWTAAAARPRRSGSRPRPDWPTCTSSGAGSRTRRSCSRRSRTSPRPRPRWRVCTWPASQPDAALAVLLRAGAALGGDALRRADLLVLTVSAALASGAPDAAQRSAAQLRLLADAGDAPLVRACADLAEGLCLVATESPERAVVLLDAARQAFTIAGRPLLAAQTWLALAEVAQADADAVAAARAAHAIAVRLDAAVLRDRAAAVLRAHGASAPRPAAGTRKLPDLTRAGDRDPRGPAAR